MKSLTPASATYLLATMLLAYLTDAVPVDTDKYVDPFPVDGDGWKQIHPWHPPDNFNWDVLYSTPKYDHGVPPSPPPGPIYPSYKQKRSAAAEADAEADPEPCKDGSCGWNPSVPWGPPPNWNPPNWGPQPGPQICSNNKAAACCTDTLLCSIVPQPVAHGLLGLNLGLQALSQACSPEQNINCCDQDAGSSLINVQSCGSLLDLL